jgi:5-(carboxyamino)imidazole ribonucleotide synthase
MSVLTNAQTLGPKSGNIQQTLGILGGGQLGRMICQAAIPLNISIAILDPSDECPARSVCTRFQKGSFKDYQTVLDFGRSVDVLSIEIEDVNIEALLQLKSEGKVISPEPEAIQLIQDKGLQKLFYQKEHLPTMPFELFENAAEVREAIAQNRFTFPFVQKTRRAGYDGLGVLVVRSESDLSRLFDVPSVVEVCCDIDKEIAVIVARNAQGECVVYDPIGMDFDPRANLISQLVYPAHLSAEITQSAIVLAKNVIEKLNMTGLLAVELFLDKNGQLQINEVAPRPHNSGHQTIESTITSQYEQHLRSVLNLPLGSTHIKVPSVMLNLLGEPGFSGPVAYEGVSECLALAGVKIHLYGKAETRPFRKMGHVTILDQSPAEADRKAEIVRNTLKVKSL